MPIDKREREQTILTPFSALLFAPPSAARLLPPSTPHRGQAYEPSPKPQGAMDLSLILPSPPPRRLLPAPSFASPPLLTPRKKFHSRRRSSLAVGSAASEAPPAQEASAEPVFGGRRELTGATVLVGSVPPSVRLTGSAVVFAVALAAGYGLGTRYGGSKAVGVGGAAVLGVASGAAAYAAHGAVSEVAAASLHNLVAGYDDPTALRSEEVEALAKRYGVSKEDAIFNAELCDLYGRYLSHVIPTGGENLAGDEVEKIIKFKNGLGIQDPEAASVHMEMGRRIFRERLETGDSESDADQRRAFQKLVYVSALVFGDAAKFLLPWKRIFKVTDAQVELAIRDNAQRLYAFSLNSLSRDFNEKILISLRECQLRYKLSDETAAEMFRERTRNFIEEDVSTALEALKSRTIASRGLNQVVEELEKVLAFNTSLTRISGHPEAVRFAVGVGPVSLLGGIFDGGRKIEDLKLLYREYATESFVKGHLEEDKIASLDHLRNIFGLGKHEAEAIMLDVTTKAYRKELSRAVSSGDLDIATSKAAYLQKLCDDLHFTPERASEVHKDIYRKKLQSCLADGELSKDDVATLLRVRVMLCIPQETVDAVNAEICGPIFEKVVNGAIQSGDRGYEEDTRTSVRKAVSGLRLSKDIAMTIASKAVRRIFLIYVQRSKDKKKLMEGAQELKRMVYFNDVVVTDLVEVIKGEPAVLSAPVKEASKVGEDEWGSLMSLRKTDLYSQKETLQNGKKSILVPYQTDITLKDDLSISDRINLYRIYLMFCASGQFSIAPMGAPIKMTIDDSEFLVLKKLGEILGLLDKEIIEVHKNFAQRAFTKEAEAVLSDGKLSKGRIEKLNEVQKYLGLPEKYAQKIIQSITTTKMTASIETAAGQGKLGINQIRELRETGIDLDSILSVRLRESLFKKIVDETFSKGTGEFNEEEVYEKIPKDLNIDVEKAKELAHELAKNRISNSLIQAVALLRQKNLDGTVSSLNNILACDKAFPCEPLLWSSPDEVGDLYCVYSMKTPKPENLSRLQYLLGISDSAAASLRLLAETDRFSTLSNEEEFAF